MKNIKDIIQYIKDIDRRLQYFERAMVIRNLTIPSDGSFTLPNVATDPVSPADGQLWFNTTDEVAKIDPFFMKSGLYDDLPPVALVTAKTGAGTPTLTAFKGNIQQYTFDASNDEVFGVSEVVHSYLEGEDIDIHIHWATNGLEGSAKYVKWEVEYSICNPNDAFPTSVVVSEEFEIPASTPDRTYFISDIGTIDGSSIEVGAYIVFRFRRIASSGSAPVADPFAIAIGFHTKHNSIGSRTDDGK